MNVRLKLLSVAVTSASLFAVLASAHDPDDFERRLKLAPVKPVPATCAELADVNNFSNDLTHPDIAALQARCEADKKAAAGKTK
jgi:hypothetical protein